ncbi:hypothetical protein AVEN_70476-1 [Araneus ventricosus]|uniref:Uncharacterized protein n=1 Tax=Araneus ventricosus TaxID=182803 RepID=A0A4Y2H0A7_ARAVE|nr:hypothetical protein AVEN_70476-1 [Araneus ventricosus]
MRVGTTAVPDNIKNFTARIQRSSSGLSPRSLKAFSIIQGRGGLVVGSRLWDRRVPGSRTDSTEEDWRGGAISGVVLVL